MLYASRFPGDDRADGARITSRRKELEPKPVITIAALVSQQQWRRTIVYDKHVQIAVVVIVTHGQPSRGKVFLKDRAGSRAYVLVLAVDVLEKQQWLFVFHF